LGSSEMAIPASSRSWLALSDRKNAARAAAIFSCGGVVGGMVRLQNVARSNYAAK
jgi:hypothetical protein